jgi:GT2 family glycosyltransferase
MCLGRSRSQKGDATLTGAMVAICSCSELKKDGHPQSCHEFPQIHEFVCHRSMARSIGVMNEKGLCGWMLRFLKASLAGLPAMEYARLSFLSLGLRSMVSVLMTTYNSARFLKACLDSLRRQTYEPLELIIVDNASTDSTRELLGQIEAQAKVIYNETNIGFAAAQNQAARSAKGSWLLSLNPDVVLSPDFILNAVAAGELDAKIGTICGKLLRWNPGGASEFTEVIDSTGIYFQPSLRHLDRGADELDRGQFEQAEYVFGATGAAALYRKTMLEDIVCQEEFFDQRFFAYREDADLAWRAQLMGWQCLYTPRAVAWHVRRVTPERRKELPLEVNWHSIKNRFLMRAKNISWPLYARYFFPIAVRDAQVVGYCLLADRRLASALTAVWKSRHELRRQRQVIQSRRRISDWELSHWFSSRPVSVPFNLPAGSQAALTI